MEALDADPAMKMQSMQIGESFSEDEAKGGCWCC
jgi:hypothetical protein